jgi:hypothetical protein
MSEKYLYGASVQGIQSFIFQTGKLKEIIGASELVETICRNVFQENVKKFIEENLIIGAAGNIRYVFEEKAECEHIVRIFPKIVMDMAPGITISQAVTVISRGNLSKALEQLEVRLKTQQNMISFPHETGFMGIERSRRTGGAKCHEERFGEEIEHQCEATRKKLDAFDRADGGGTGNTLYEKFSGNPVISSRNRVSDFSEMNRSKGNSWIAVVHADGNGVGNLIKKIWSRIADLGEDEQKAVFRRFSKSLDESTKKAAQAAFERMREGLVGHSKIPFRPVILGGDDLTVIVRADLAIEFTQNFLKEFENATAECLRFLSEQYGIPGCESGLTSCAGIAFIKSSYPFHYAADLSEMLCREAKDYVSRQFDGSPKSALSFYKVHDSFISDDLDEMKGRTMRINDVNFDFGPYLLWPHAGFADVGKLILLLDALRKLEDEESVDGKGKSFSKLRQWVSEIQKDRESAALMLDRIKTTNKNLYEKLEMHKEPGEKSVIYDLLQLHNFKN